MTKKWQIYDVDEEKVNKISEEFKINIPITYIIPENFNSADAMFKMISLLKK